MAAELVVRARRAVVDGSERAVSVEVTGGVITAIHPYDARVEAARVGLAQSAWLPTVDGQAALSRNRSDGQNANQRSASLTLSLLMLLAIGALLVATARPLAVMTASSLFEFA